MSRDKRRYPRVHAKNVSAHLNVADTSSPCVIQNISAGGIFIETSDALPVGMPVAVNLARAGWTRVLRVSGRVVWAIAARTAAKKGTLPGMRIKFDAQTKANAADLMMLLQDLGASDSPPPVTVADSEVHKRLSREIPAAPLRPSSGQAVSLKSIQARVSKLDDVTQPPLAKPLPSTIVSEDFHSPAPRPTASGPRYKGPTQQQVGPSDGPRLAIQVQGLLMQMGDLQTQLEQRDKELASIRERLKQKEEQLDKADRERKAAELAIQRLAMQLAARR